MSKLPPPDVMYDALANRDPAYDGIFYVAVKTTRIFCRSVWHARTPKRENVEFYARPHDALYAGYRPCLRCRPLETRGRPAPMVEKLLAAVEADPSGRLREADLTRMGIDPSTARRQFQRYCGMSFHAYHRARRMGMALTGVREGKSMIDLQLDQGFESSSGFREAFAKVFGTAPSLARDVDCLFAKWFETPLGPMLALNDAGLYLLEFVDRRGLEREVQALRRRLTQHVVPGEHRYLDRIGGELEAYFSGRSLNFHYPPATQRLAVPMYGMGGAARDSRRGDGCLRRHRGENRTSGGSACGRARQRRQQAGDYRAVPSRDRRRRDADRVRRRTVAEGIGCWSTSARLRVPGASLPWSLHCPAAAAA